MFPLPCYPCRILILLTAHSFFLSRCSVPNVLSAIFPSCFIDRSHFYTQLYVHVHAHIHVRTHARARTHAYTRTHTHTHKHAHARTRAHKHNTAQHSTTQHNTAQHSTAQHSTAQHSTAQHSTAQHSTTQHNTTHDFPRPTRDIHHVGQGLESFIGDREWCRWNGVKI